MMRRGLIEQALAESVTLQARYPDVETITSIIHQLEFLLALEDGQVVDRSRLGEIILGVQAAREIEPLDLPLAEKLHEINAEVERQRV